MLFPVSAFEFRDLFQSLQVSYSRWYAFLPAWIFSWDGLDPNFETHLKITYTKVPRDRGIMVKTTNIVIELACLATILSTGFDKPAPVHGCTFLCFQHWKIGKFNLNFMKYQNFDKKVGNKFLRRSAYTWSLPFLSDPRYRDFQYSPRKRLESRFSTVNNLLYWHHIQDHRNFSHIIFELIWATLDVRFLPFVWLCFRSINGKNRGNFRNYWPLLQYWLVESGKLTVDGLSDHIWPIFWLRSF